MTTALGSKGMQVSLIGIVIFLVSIVLLIALPDGLPIAGMLVGGMMVWGGFIWTLAQWYATPPEAR
jgi:uncharacterized membrane protein YkgB